MPNNELPPEQRGATLSGTEEASGEAIGPVIESASTPKKLGEAFMVVYRPQTSEGMAARVERLKDTDARLRKELPHPSGKIEHERMVY